MRNLLALIGLGVVVFFGAGWYFGWYKVQREVVDHTRSFRKTLGDAASKMASEGDKKPEEPVKKEQPTAPMNSNNQKSFWQGGNWPEQPNVFKSTGSGETTPKARTNGSEINPFDRFPARP
jgi:hypothetical protein